MSSSGAVFRRALLALVLTLARPDRVGFLQELARISLFMQWLGLTWDEEPVYQTALRDTHREAAERLLRQGDAYRAAKGGEGEAILFRIPLAAERVPGGRCRRTRSSAGE